MLTVILMFVFVLGVRNVGSDGVGVYSVVGVVGVGVGGGGVVDYVVRFGVLYSHRCWCCW